MNNLTNCAGQALTKIADKLLPQDAGKAVKGLLLLGVGYLIFKL